MSVISFEAPAVVSIVSLPPAATHSSNLLRAVIQCYVLCFIADSCWWYLHILHRCWWSVVWLGQNEGVGRQHNLPQHHV